MQRPDVHSMHDAFKTPVTPIDMKATPSFQKHFKEDLKTLFSFHIRYSYNNAYISLGVIHINNAYTSLGVNDFSF